MALIPQESFFLTVRPCLLDVICKDFGPEFHQRQETFFGSLKLDKVDSAPVSCPAIQ
jgi:hypothetical protein